MLTEIHDSLSPAYSLFYKNNTYDAIIGLSATITKSTTYEENGTTFTKGDLLAKICPIIYSYTIDESQKDETSRKLEINVVLHKLDETRKTIKAGSKVNPFMQTERAAYDYWHKQFQRALFINDEQVKSFKLRITSTKRSQILYNLPSKVPLVQKILSKLQDKTIVFGNSLDTLLQITPNVVSSRNSNKKNDEIYYQFFVFSSTVLD